MPPKNAHQENSFFSHEKKVANKLMQLKKWGSKKVNRQGQQTLQAKGNNTKPILAVPKGIIDLIMSQVSQYEDAKNLTCAMPLF